MDPSTQADFPGPRRRRIRRGVIGVLMRDRELLMVRRAAGIAKGGFWCFPGGHVEAGETPRSAIVREIMEELGLVVEPIRHLGYVRVLDSDHVLSVWQIRSLRYDLRPAPSEIAEVRWLSFAEAWAIEPGLASNLDVFRMLSL